MEKRSLISEERLRTFMEEAIKEALKAQSVGEIPVGAVVVKGDEIIGRGGNRRRACQDPTAHSEIIALREAAHNLSTWNLSGCDIYVTLEPCPMCAGAIVQSRIRRLIYGCSDPKAGASGTLYDITGDTRLNHRCDTIKGVMEGRCRKILQEFFIECRKDFSKLPPER